MVGIYVTVRLGEMVMTNTTQNPNHTPKLQIRQLKTAAARNLDRKKSKSVMTHHVTNRGTKETQ